MRNPYQTVMGKRRMPVCFQTVMGDLIAVPAKQEGVYALYYNGDEVARGTEEELKEAIAYYMQYWKRNPRRYEHERFASPGTLQRRGLTKYRSIVTPKGDVLRLAFPPGQRRRGSGEVQAILHRKNPHRAGYVEWKQVHESTDEELRNRLIDLKKQRNEKYGYPLSQLRELHLIHSELYVRAKGLPSRPGVIYT